jgi:hypothetical protein
LYDGFLKISFLNPKASLKNLALEGVSKVRTELAFFRFIEGFFRIVVLT